MTPLSKALLRLVARAGRIAYRGLARIRYRNKRKPALIDAYLGYSTPVAYIARGRLLTQLRGHDPRHGQRRLVNLWQMLSLFQTDEVAGVAVAAGPAVAISDDEGYFTLNLPRDAAGGAIKSAADPGWIGIEAAAHDARTTLPVQVTRPDAQFGVISDIDDTMIYTGAWQLWRNLWNSLTGNALTRQVFPDAVTLMDALSDRGRNPVFYVSSSPWNFHGFLESVMARSALVRGPMFLRDLGRSSLKRSGGSHQSHKARVIDRVLAANPDLGFVLLGDTGQYDPEIYRHAAERHPGRIVRVILRRAGRPAPGSEIAALTALGVWIDVVEDYRPVIDDLASTSLPAGFQQAR